MIDKNGMFSLESVTEHDFDTADDFFDAVVSSVQTPHQDTVKIEKAADVISEVQTDVQKQVVTEQINNAQIDVEQSAAEQDKADVNKWDLSANKEKENKEPAVFQAVEELVNDNIVIVPDEINITKYKGGVVLPREQVEKLTYPCVYIRAKQLPAYKATALKAMLSRGTFDGDAVIYVCYLEYQGTVMELGYLDNKVMREMINSTVFADMDVVVYLSEDKQISGVYINALCAV